MPDVQSPSIPFDVGDIIVLADRAGVQADAAFSRGIVIGKHRSTGDAPALQVYLFDPGGGALERDADGNPVLRTVAASVAVLHWTCPKQERRGFVRRPAHGAVLFKPITDGPDVPMTHVALLDMSEAGAGMLVPGEIPVCIGQKVQLGFMATDTYQAILVEGVVRAIVPTRTDDDLEDEALAPNRVCCQFVRLSDEELAPFVK